ncbi:MAG: hypothetical protein IJM09_03310 [Neisseriaceae bacterium]|nr:hypothetical protein [Neisseriaceae bacterium]
MKKRTIFCNRPFFLVKYFQAETFAKLNLKQKSVRYRVGILAHHSACGVYYLLIFKKILPCRAVGGLESPPYKIYIYYIDK